MFAYCNNKPIIYLDREGKVISLALIGGIALCALTSGLVSGLLSVVDTLLPTESDKEGNYTSQELVASFAGGFVSGAISGGISAAVLASGSVGAGLVVLINLIGGVTGSALGFATEKALSGKPEEILTWDLLEETLWGGAFGVVGGLMEGPVKAVSPQKFLKESKKFFSNAFEGLFGGFCEWVERKLIQGYAEFVTN